MFGLLVRSLSVVSIADFSGISTNDLALFLVERFFVLFADSHFMNFGISHGPGHKRYGRGVKSRGARGPRGWECITWAVGAWPYNAVARIYDIFGSRVSKR